MNGDIELNDNIKFECSIYETGDAMMKFEDGIEMSVGDLAHYYSLSAEILPFCEDSDEVTQTINSEMSREDYGILCREYIEGLK